MVPAHRAEHRSFSVPAHRAVHHSFLVPAHRAVHHLVVRAHRAPHHHRFSVPAHRAVHHSFLVPARRAVHHLVVRAHRAPHHHRLVRACRRPHYYYSVRAHRAPHRLVRAHRAPHYYYFQLSRCRGHRPDSQPQPLPYLEFVSAFVRLVHVYFLGEFVCASRALAAFHTNPFHRLNFVAHRQLLVQLARRAYLRLTHSLLCWTDFRLSCCKTFAHWRRSHRHFVFAQYVRLQLGSHSYAPHAVHLVGVG